MAASSYDDSLRRLLAHEGGYTNHPADPGGPTNFGITISDYRKYVKPNATAADVQAMRLDAAKAIYRAKYWDALRCDDLPAGVDYCVFDYGVNSGIARSARVLQRVLGVAVDGCIGPVTLAGARSRDAEAVIESICDERLAFLQGLKTWPVFGNGWGRRVAEVRSVALHMAKGADRSAVASSPPAPHAAVAKGELPPPIGAQAGTAGAIVTAGAVIAAQAHGGTTIAVIVAATAVAAVAAWLGWSWWRAQRQQRPAR